MPLYLKVRIGHRIFRATFEVEIHDVQCNHQATDGVVIDNLLHLAIEGPTCHGEFTINAPVSVLLFLNSFQCKISIATLWWIYGHVIARKLVFPLQIHSSISDFLNMSGADYIMEGSSYKIKKQGQNLYLHGVYFDEL